MAKTETINSDNKIMRIALAQLNPIMGDIEKNLQLARKARLQAKAQKADLIVFSELFISGYPPEDLVLKPSFTKTCEQAVLELAQDTLDGGPGVIIGLPLHREGKIYNSVMVLDQGTCLGERYKVDLPNYGEFDEKRIFSCGPMPEPLKYRGISLGLPICEDIWNDPNFSKHLTDQGAQLLIVINGSPYSRHKPAKRAFVAAAQAHNSQLPLIYVNQFGGQDELVFDGGSFGIDCGGNITFQMKHFQEDLAITTWEETLFGWNCTDGPHEKCLDGHEADYHACMISFGDYVNKNGFKNVVLGLSGGIDSALCAAIAVDALGAKRVHAIMLPYKYTSQESLKDAEECAKLLACQYETISISAPIQGFLSALKDTFANTDAGVTEENLQSRTRGTILMALSNKFGSMVVTTGNKSEMCVGYATLYGDMNGGFNPIKDLYKMQVYALSNWRNNHYPHGSKGPQGRVIPQNIIDKAPSAELRDNQTDQDSLPPYPILDEILECLVEQEMSIEDIVERGFDHKTVKKIENMLYIAEFKRRQSAPGVKITSKNFGRDRRYPITNHFRDD